MVWGYKMNDYFATAEKYLDRAKELRSIAEGLANANSQVALRQVANEYEHMARMAIGAAMVLTGSAATVPF
jgi:hypothetical protein